MTIPARIIRFLTPWRRRPPAPDPYTGGLPDTVRTIGHAEYAAALRAIADHRVKPRPRRSFR